LPLQCNKNDFIFDNQILLQAHIAGFRIGEFTCPTRYFPEASSINFRRGMIYSFSCLWMSVLFVLANTGIYESAIFKGLRRKQERQHIGSQ
jgi:hypothetical protein